MGTPAFRQGRIVYDPSGSGKSEHGLHHFHGLILEAYAEAGSGTSDFSGIIRMLRSPTS